MRAIHVIRMDSSRTLHLSSPPLSLSAEPSDVVAPSPQYALLGASISLQCSIPRINNVLDTWRHGDSEDIRPEGSAFSSVSYSDEGTYTCRLTHIPMEMMPAERSIELRITGKLVEPQSVTRCIYS